MNYIDLLNNPPEEALIKEGEKLTKELSSLPKGDRADYIERHKSYWGKLKKHYSKLSHGKCWYTDAKDVASDYHMDHFRPKKQTKELTKKAPKINEVPLKTSNNADSYWWLAFDWKNYRFSASIPNESKHTYFPLKEGTKAAQKSEELANEWPGLLDPTVEDDVELITFNEEGKVCPAVENDECWDAQRVLLSVEVYNLNAKSLSDARKEVQQSCEQLIRKIKSARENYYKKDDPSYRGLYKELLEDLRKKTKEDVELSSVALEYIRNYPDKHIRKIVERR